MLYKERPLHPLAREKEILKMATPGSYERTTTGMGGSARETTQRIREAAHPGEMFEQVGAEGRMNEMMDQASTWMQDNSGKLLTSVGVLAAAGLIGYLIGRNRAQTSDIQSI